VPPETFLTREGYEKLRKELDRLRKRREELAKEIGEAAEKGDLKENAEYHAAKEEQQKVVRRRDELEQKLRSARILEEADIQPGEVRIGCSVDLQENPGGEKTTYTLVDGAEADFSKGRISVHSPVAQGLLGHKEGDEVSINLPAGQVKYKVLKVVRSL